LNPPSIIGKLRRAWKGNRIGRIRVAATNADALQISKARVFVIAAEKVGNAGLFYHLPDHFSTQRIGE
jgi:hypothetical protein